VWQAKAFGDEICAIAPVWQSAELAFIGKHPHIREVVFSQPEHPAMQAGSH
jgi:hypothetical protein